MEIGVWNFGVWNFRFECFGLGFGFFLRFEILEFGVFGLIFQVWDSAFLVFGFLDWCLEFGILILGFWACDLEF